MRLLLPRTLALPPQAPNSGTRSPALSEANEDGAGVKHCWLMFAGITLAFSGFAQAQAVYKCTNPDGSVSFQDRACPGASQEKRVSIDSSSRSGRDDFEVKVVTLPGVGEAAVLVYDYMDIARREVGAQTTTVRVRSKTGSGDKVNLQMTFRPNPGGEIPSRQEQEREVTRLARAGSGFSSKMGDLQEFNPRSGSGLFAVASKPRQPGSVANGGDYMTRTAGRIVDHNVIVDVAILSDGVRNKAFADALSIVESFAVADDIVSTDQSGALSLPEAPAGFSWLRLPEIKGAFLKPAGWYYETDHKGNDLEYHISREPNTPPNGFDTGLTVSIETNVPARKGKSPSAHAQAFVEEFTSAFETVGESFSSGRGPYTSHGALVRVVDPQKGAFNAHVVAIANDSSGTVYLCIFEGPAAKWDEIWPIGELMIQKMAINDSI